MHKDIIPPSWTMRKKPLGVATGGGPVAHNKMSTQELSLALGNFESFGYWIYYQTTSCGGIPWNNLSHMVLGVWCYCHAFWHHEAKIPMVKPLGHEA